MENGANKFTKKQQCFYSLINFQPTNMHNKIEKSWLKPGEDRRPHISN